MDDQHSIKKPIKLVSIIFTALIILSFLPTEFSVLGIQLKPVDLISDFEADPYGDYYDYEIDDSTNYDDPADEEEIFDETDSTATGKTVKASMPFSLLFDLIVNNQPKVKTDVHANFKDVKIEGNLEQMKYFFDALKKSDKEIVRIAHYGDSAIEGDNITSEFRDILQKEFGGSGLGFLAITSQDVRFRPTITHTFSDTWENASIFMGNPKNLPVGINGEVFVPERHSWIQYKTTNRYRRLKEFKKVRLFYSNASKSNIYYEFDNSNKTAVEIKNSDKVQEVSFSPKRKAKEVRIEFTQKDQGYFYGVSLENGEGILVDNFPLRGNSGVNLNDIELDRLKEFSKVFDYKLIVLHFGLNIAGTDKTTDYTWYEREMIKVIQKYKKAFPKCSILVVSVSDKSIKRGSNFVTNPSIPILVKAQRDIARKAKVAFWNLFEAMGGINSMHDWVTSAPPLASKDYTHFTLQGSKKAAQMMAEALIQAYKENK